MDQRPMRSFKVNSIHADIVAQTLASHRINASFAWAPGIKDTTFLIFENKDLLYAYALAVWTIEGMPMKRGDQ